MYKRLAPVGIFLFVDASVAADEPARRGRHHGVFQNRLIEQVDLLLCALADVDIAVSGNGALHREQRIDHERIISVLVKPALHIWVVLGRGKDRLAHEFAEVEHAFSVLDLLVVPVHHERLVRRIHLIVRLVLADKGVVASKRVADLRIPLPDHVVVHQLRVEQVFAFLDVGHARFPEEVEQIDLPDGYIPESVELGAVPEHAPSHRSLLHLRPARIGIGLLEIVLFEDHRHDAGQHRRLGAVVRLSWPDSRLRERRHGVRVLAHNDVEEPSRPPLWVVWIPARTHFLPVLELPPLLAGNEPLFKR